MPFNIKMSSNIKMGSTPFLHNSVNYDFSVKEGSSWISPFHSFSILRRQILFIPFLEYLFSLLILCLTPV